MSESLKLTEDELFKAGFNRVAIRMRTANEKSKSVPERNGYTHEGTLRNHIIENNEVRSSHIYSKLREEWETKK